MALAAMDQALKAAGASHHGTDTGGVVIAVAINAIACAQIQYQQLRPAACRRLRAAQDELPNKTSQLEMSCNLHAGSCWCESNSKGAGCMYYGRGMRELRQSAHTAYMSGVARRSRRNSSCTRFAGGRSDADAVNAAAF